LQQYFASCLSVLRFVPVLISKVSCNLSHPVLWQVPVAAGKKKNKKRGEKYGALESARPEKGRRVSSTRYTTEPRKEDPKSIYAPMTGASASNRNTAAESDKNAEGLQLLVDPENDYLLPQSTGAAANYMDVVSDYTQGISCCILFILFGYIECTNPIA